MSAAIDTLGLMMVAGICAAVISITDAYTRRPIVNGIRAAKRHVRLTWCRVRGNTRNRRRVGKLPPSFWRNMGVLL